MGDEDSFLNDVPSDKVFWFHTGAAVRNIYELTKTIRYLDNYNFIYHCNSDHDDFAIWIDETLGDEWLADKLRKLKDKTKENYAGVIEKRIYFLERKHISKGLNKVFYIEPQEEIKKNLNILLKVAVVILILLFLATIYIQTISTHNILVLNEKIDSLEQKNNYFTNYVAEQLLKTQDMIQPTNTTDYASEGRCNISMIVGDKNNPIGSSPHVLQKNILVFENMVLINITNSSWAIFKNTSSMIPVLNENSKSIEITPEKIDDLHVGDIISYESNDELIVHRIAAMGYDDQGFYATVKGDNNRFPDSDKVRFDQIQGIVVAVIY